MNYTINIRLNVTAERMQGKFASRTEVEDLILEALETAMQDGNPDTIDCEQGGVYEVTEWEFEIEAMER